MTVAQRISHRAGVTSLDRTAQIIASPERAVVPSFVAIVSRVLSSRRCTLLLPGGDGRLVIEESIGLPPGVAEIADVASPDGVAALAAQRRSPVIVNDGDERRGLPSPRGTYISVPFVCFPFRLADGSVAVIAATERADDVPFGLTDLALLSELTSFYAATVDLSARREVRRLRAELRRERMRFIQRQEEERQRLARELHDDAGHALTSAILRLDMAAGRLIGRGELTEALDQTREALVECAGQLHDLAFELQPRLLADLGLGPALRSLARRTREIGSVEVDLSIEGDERRLSSEAELAIFRIAQEAITNALKHAGAAVIAIRLTFTPDIVTVEIRDNGAGFVPAPPSDTNRSRHGLNGMRERAELVGGTLEVSSQPGAGTAIRAHLPNRPVS